MDKCLTSEECLSKLGPEAEGKELLVPLSNCVYVPGFLTGADKAIIGIGTGYYVEKDVQEAKEVFKRKEKMVQEQIEKVQKAAQEKVRRILSTVCPAFALDVECSHLVPCYRRIH